MPVNVKVDLFVSLKDRGLHVITAGQFVWPFKTEAPYGLIVTL